MAFIRAGGFRVALAAILVLGIAAAAAGTAFYLMILRDLPDLRSVDDYAPPQASHVFDRKGRMIGEFFVERRRLVEMEEIPRHTQLAFVAAEDGGFFEHKGIDYAGILRAALANLRAGGEIKQGASTITQQTVKSLLLTPERTVRRKIREMVLARQLEEHLSKDEILYLYLNQMYYGHGAHGLREAARTYFGKDVGELTVSESAMLAGLLQRPSSYSPYRNPDLAEGRRHYVLGRMLADDFIDEDIYEQAMAEVPELAPADLMEEASSARYFTEEVRRYLFERLGGDVVLEGGLVIETTVDLDLQTAAVAAVKKGLEEQDRRTGYRGPVRRVKPDEIEAEILRVAEENGLLPEVEEADETAEVDDLEVEEADETAEVADFEVEEARDELAAAVAEDGTGQRPDSDTPLADVAEHPLTLGEPFLGVVTAVDAKAKTADVAFAPEILGRAHLADVDWARKPHPKRRSRPVRKIERIFSVGDVAQFVRLEDEESAEEQADAVETAPLARLGLHQDPIVQGALFSLEVGTGDVLALVGGYEFDESQFNRATQALRQPGSAFKPLIYGAALAQGYTPVSTLYDRPAVFEDPVSGFVWRPRNYERKFFGPIPMRYALAHSINNATVHLFRDLGVDYVIDYARRLGVSAPLNRDLSLAVGSSSMTLFELTRAYAVFPSGGRRVVPRFVVRVTDQNGEVLLENLALGESPPSDEEPAEGTSEQTMAEAAAESVEQETAVASSPDEELPDSDQLIPEASAYLMCDLLKAVVKEGTGKRLKVLGRPLAGKTGTTNDYIDAWFIGFSPDIATGVWVGHDADRALGYGESGAIAALPIWKDYMAVALADRAVRDFDVPDEIVFQRIDRISGLLADADSKDAYFQPFIENTGPTETASSATTHIDVERRLRADSF